MRKKEGSINVDLKMLLIDKLFPVIGSKSFEVKDNLRICFIIIIFFSLYNSINTYEKIDRIL